MIRAALAAVCLAVCLAIAGPSAAQYVNGGGDSSSGGCVPPGSTLHLLYDNGASACLASGATTTIGGTITVPTGQNFILTGSSTGKSTIASANAGASDYTVTIPAVTDTFAMLAASQTLTNKTLTSPIIATGATLSWLTGSTQCLQVNTSGVVAGTPCGSGASGNPTASVGLAAVNGVSSNYMAADSAPALSQSIAPTWTGEHTFSAAGAASTPGILFNGTLFSGGSATTTVPWLYYNLSGVAVTTWNTAGTIFGFNLPNGCGNVFDIHVAGGASVAKLDCAGTLTLNSSLNFVSGGANLTAGTSTGRVDAGATGKFTFNQVMWASGTAPTLSGTGLGTSPSIVALGTQSGYITVGSSPAQASFTLTFVAAAHGWTCTLNDETNNASLTIGETSHTTTTAVFLAYARSNGAPAALNGSDVVGYQCGGN